MRVLIDSDSISWIIAYFMKDELYSTETVQDVINLTDQFINQILINCKADTYLGFLGGSQLTFRHLSDSTYKASRGTVKPDWYKMWGGLVSHRLKHYWKFYTVEGIEAEDAVSMLSYYYRDLNPELDPIIAGIDHDLLQIPGNHYNYKKHEFLHAITTDEAYYNLFKQVLTGCKTDEVTGLPGIGEVKAKKLLDQIHTTEIASVVLREFCNYYGQREGILNFANTYNLIKLLDRVPTDLIFDYNEYQWSEYNSEVIIEKQELFENLVNSNKQVNESDAAKYFTEHTV